MDRLNTLDTTDVPAMAQTLLIVSVSANRNKGRNAFRTPTEKTFTTGYDHLCRTMKALANAPETDGTFFTVPKVIERA
jgi:Asp-tRNA(Asn)/Glu-tRNA(Gln) amidotransferase C subunit